MDQHGNVVVSAVATAPSPATSGGSLVVTAGQGTWFSTVAVPYNVTISPSNAIATPSNSEIARVTAVASDTVSITRAVEGSSARTVVVGDLIAITATVKAFNDIERHARVFARATYR